jgi:hypothetical protein
MDKDKLVSELERYIEFCNKTRLTQEDGISCAGHKDFDKYPVGTPGIHPYWDDEMESVQVAEGMLEWIKTGIIPNNPNLYKNTFQCKINLINYIELNPQFKNLIIGECGRGIEVLLALACREDWEHIICFDFKGIYKKLVEDFFKDDRVLFLEQQSCYFDFNLLKDDNYMLILTHSLPHSLKHFINEPKIKMIIKEGVLVDKSKHWREHKPMDVFETVYEDLITQVYKKDAEPEVEIKDEFPKEKLNYFDKIKNYYKKLRR